MGNHRVPLGHTTSVLGSARNARRGELSRGVSSWRPAEATCREHANWYSGQGCDSFPHTHTHISGPYCRHIPRLCSHARQEFHEPDHRSDRGNILSCISAGELNYTSASCRRLSLQPFFKPLCSNLNPGFCVVIHNR